MAAPTTDAPDLLDPTLYVDGVPHDRLAWLREHDPVHWHREPGDGPGFWALTRYRDVKAVEADSASFSSEPSTVIVDTVAMSTGGTAKAIADPGVMAPRTPSVVLTPGLARQAVAAAWQTAGMGSDERRLDDIVTRARWSAVLPEVRLRAIRWDNERLYSYGTDDRTRDATGANLGLEGRLTWRLDRLLYAEDEPAFERIRLERQETRMRIAQRVLEALFHWQRAVIELRAATPATLEEAEAASKVAEAEAALDVLTAGWFSTRRASKP